MAQRTGDWDYQLIPITLNRRPFGSISGPAVAYNDESAAFQADELVSGPW
jgi:hypothetical protein